MMLNSKSPQEQLVEIALPGPFRKTFTYWHDGSELPAAGQRVLVPFGHRRQVGFFLGPASTAPAAEIKPITRVLDEPSYFLPELFDLCLWVARYYFANPAECLQAALPPQLRRRHRTRLLWQQVPPCLPADLGSQVRPGKAVSAAVLQKLRRRRGLLTQLLQEGAIVEVFSSGGEAGHRLAGYRVGDEAAWSRFCSGTFHPASFAGTLTRQELRRLGWSDYQLRRAREHRALVAVPATDPVAVLPFIGSRGEVRSIHLSTEQEEVLSALMAGIDQGFGVSLLHGVTGSGKTLVYCHLCEEVLRRGRTALVLTPEIALAGTTLAYFRGFFADQVTVIHSAMTDAERLESWQGIRSGKYGIVVGPRSALFAPLPRLGVIVVDEEHDSSYKQDDPSPRFQGRDVAIMRAKMNRIPAVLGSASPSIESYYHATTGRYRLLQLTQRPTGAKLPAVSVVDMRTDRLEGDLTFLSHTLVQRVRKRLAAGQQVIVYLNRRGHSPRLKCVECGHVPQCRSCQVVLTYHRVGHQLCCHYCGQSTPAPSVCPVCGGRRMEFLGAGTQKVEQALPIVLPEARIVRLDSDSASGRRRAWQILSAFGAAEYDILLGTQMVTKGLDFPRVTLVGVLASDQSLDMPDFRASERTLARLLQVAGRAGRAEQPGEVLIQTYYPESELIHHAARQDYQAFYESEIKSRRELDYPPFARLVHVVLSGVNEKTVQDCSQRLAQDFQVLINRHRLSVTLLGPAPCPLYRLRGRYRRQLLLKTPRILELLKILDEREASAPRFGLPTSVRVAVNVDPDDMM